MAGLAIAAGGLPGWVARTSRAADEPAGPAAEAAISPADVELFEKKVRPVLAERCWKCHGPDAQEGELRLDSRTAGLAGGSRGPAWTAGAPAKSLLVSAINHADTLQMPPKEKLPPAQIADLTEWIRRGAPWPGEPAGTPPPTRPVVAKAGESPITAEQREFWAFRRLAAPALPPGPDPAWTRTGLDRFIQVGLAEHQLTPAPVADRRTLIRRVTFDLHGIGPTPDEIQEFLADSGPDAWDRLLDRLLASPRYGQRWGRHWLDIARYGDSNGLDENLALANAFRYRDYVIAAINADVPYDTFVQEQLAGDLLPVDGDPDDPSVAARQAARLTATGYLVVGAKMLAEDDPVKMQMDIVDEQVETLGKGILGLTLGCARCHDHKYDPVSMGDYYGLAGIFTSTKTMENFSVVARWQERLLATPSELRQLAAQRQAIAEREADIQRQVTAATEQVSDQMRAQAGRYLLAAQRQLYRDEQLRLVKSVGAARQADPALEAPAGLHVLEAENYVRGNALRTNTGYGEGIGVILNAGPLPNVAEYDVAVDSADLYQLEIRYAAAEARPVTLSINGQVVKTAAAGGATGSWNPDTQTWSVEGFYPLRAGNNVIRLERAQPFPHIDKLLVVPAPPAVRRLAPLTPPTAEKPDSAENPALAPIYIQQWAEVLQRTKDQADSPLAEWHAYARRIAGDSDVKLPTPKLAILTGSPPNTWDELAEQYQAAFAAALAAWQKSQADPATAPAKALADPRLEALRQLLFDPKGPLAVPKSIEELFPLATRDALTRQRAEVKQRQAALPQYPEAMAVSDGTAADLRIHLRGNHTSLGDLVPRRLPRVLVDDGSPVQFDTQSSGRLQLAQWLTRPDHPLTSRVFVNRVWHWHFGAGLVRSPDNFGQLGERPTHPELLDWLAVQFVARDWSLKRLHRELLGSATYAQSSVMRPEAQQVDPENRTWWRFPPRRLEVEAIRDSILAASGQLDNRIGGSLLTTGNRQYVTSTANVNPVVYETTRRSVYLPVVRSALYEVFQAFDFAEPSVLNGQRDSTTVAPQALFMMNSALVARQASALARELIAQTSLLDDERLQAAYLRTLGREPTPAERERTLNFVHQYEAAAQAAPPPAAVPPLPGQQPEQPLTPHGRAWQAVCRALFASNEFVYVD